MVKESISKNSPVLVKLNIEVSPDQVNAHLNEYFGGLAKYVKIQGFRPGKAPLHVVKKLYGKEASKEISQQLVSESLLEVVRKHDLKIILPPTLTAVDSPKEDKAFCFEAEVDLKPEVPEINCSSIEIQVPEKPTVNDKQVEDELKAAHEQFVHYHRIKENRPIKSDDSTVVQYEGKVDGQKIEKASAEKQELILGSGQVTPEFETAILGLKEGENTNFEIDFPEDHQVDEVKGRKLQFDIKILEIHEKHLPELNEELIKKIHPEAKNLDELKSLLRKTLEDQTEHRHTKSVRNELGKALVEKYPFEISARQRQMTAESFARDSVQQMIQMGLKENELMDRQAQIMEESAKSAEHQIRLSYILEKIARQQDLKVSDKDIEERLEKTAKLTNLGLSEIKKYYAGKDEDAAISRMERLKMDIMDEKSLDYALSKARIKNEDIDKK